MTKEDKVEIISSGTEILQGLYPDTNAQFISSELEKIGLKTFFHTVVRDDPETTRIALEIAVKRSDVVIMTGGLGPTFDDLNRNIIAEIYNETLIEDEKQKELVAERFAKRNITMPLSNKSQWLVPEDSITLYNYWGTAAGFIIEGGNLATIIALPGPPREMKPMFAEAVIPYLKDKFPTGRFSKILTLHIINRSESDLNQKIENLFKTDDDLILALLVKDGYIDVRLTGYGNSEEEINSKLTHLSDKIVERIGKDDIYGRADDTLESVVSDLLKQKKLTISVAESCTGGGIANRLIHIPGASNIINECYIVYSNESKMRILGLKGETIKLYGAVSSQTAEEMAIGLRDLSGADIGLSITGIAGPDGGTADKPIGLVYLGIATKDGVKTRKLNLLGNRNQIMHFAANHALDFVRRELLNI